MKIVAAFLALAALAACLIAPILFFLGRTDAETYKTVLLMSSILYFIFATLSAARKPAAEI